jgi:hypothetical protein
VYSPNFFTFLKNTQAVFRYVRHEAIGWPRRKPTRYNQVWRRSASTPTTLWKKRTWFCNGGGYEKLCFFKHQQKVGGQGLSYFWWWGLRLR